MRILAGRFPQQVLQRNRRDRDVAIASGLTTAKGSVHAVIKSLRGGARPRVVGTARGGKFSINLMPTRLAHVGVVSALDLPLVDNIHLNGAAQQRLGLRLVRLASRLFYDDRREAEPPCITQVRHIPQTKSAHPAKLIEVSFANVASSLHSLNEHSFTLVDAEHRILDAIIRTELFEDRVRLWIWPNLTKAGALLVYGNGCNPSATLVDERDCALPVTGPLTIEGEMLTGPEFLTWAGGMTVHGENLSALTAKRAVRLTSQEPMLTNNESWSPAFINRHEHWIGKAGVACFTTECDASVAVKLFQGFGYDDPVRLWLDEKENQIQSAWHQSLRGRPTENPRQGLGRPTPALRSHRREWRRRVGFHPSLARYASVHLARARLRVCVSSPR